MMALPAVTDGLRCERRRERSSPHARGPLPSGSASAKACQALASQQNRGTPQKANLTCAGCATETSRF